MSDPTIPHVDSHKDLGVILSEDLIIAHAYKTLELNATDIFL